MGAERLDMGMRVLKLVDEGVEVKKAKGEVERKYGKSASYIDHCMKLARTHYRGLREGIAQSDPEVASRGRIWPKLSAEQRIAKELATRKPTIVRINNVDVLQDHHRSG